MTFFYLFLRIAILFVIADVLFFFGYEKLYSLYLTKKVKGKWKKVHLIETRYVMTVLFVGTATAILLFFLQLIYMQTMKNDDLFLLDREWWLADYLLIFEIYCLIDWVLLTAFYLIRYRNISFLKVVPFSLRLPLIMCISLAWEASLPTPFSMSFVTGAVLYAIVLFGIMLYRFFVFKSKREIIFQIVEFLWKIISLVIIFTLLLGVLNSVYEFVRTLSITFLVISILLLVAKMIDLIWNTFRSLEFLTEWRVWSRKQELSEEEKEDFLSFKKYFPFRYFCFFRGLFQDRES